MTNKEIIEGNKLIAKFMGAVNEMPKGWILFGCVPEWVTEESHFFIPEHFKFHSSWDWLQPIVAKCWNITSEFQYDDEEYLHITEEIFHPDYMLAEFMNADITSIWQRVIEFIEWYNQNKE